MSLDFRLKKMQMTTVFDSNITHNLGKMADAVGVYYALWHPEEKGYKTALDIISILEEGLKQLELEPEKFKKFNAPNGWGKYEHFVPFVKGCLSACKTYPDALLDPSA